MKGDLTFLGAEWFLLPSNSTKLEDAVTKSHDNGRGLNFTLPIDSPMGQYHCVMFVKDVPVCVSRAAHLHHHDCITIDMPDWVTRPA